MDSDFIALQASSDRDPDGLKLRKALGAHLALEQARAARALLVHVSAALGVPLGAVALWPEWFSPGGHRLVLGAWALSGVAAVAAAAREWWWRRRRDFEAADLLVEPPARH